MPLQALQRQVIFSQQLQKSLKIFNCYWRWFQRLPLHVHKVTGPRPSVHRHGNCGKTVCILNFLPDSEWICWWQAGWWRVLWLPWKYFRHWQPYKKSSKKINSDSLLPPFIIINHYIIKYSYGKYVYYVLGLWNNLC